MPKKFRPFTLSAHQIPRILKRPIHSGFFAVRDGEETYTIADFKVDESGKLLTLDGEPLTYTLEDGTEIEYRICKTAE